MELFKIKSSIAGLLFVTWFIVAALTAEATPPSQWSSRGIGGGGAFFGASFSPYNANELYIGCDMTDLFHSTDLGASWNTVDFRQIVSFHSTKVNFTSDANILYTVDYASNNGTNAARPKKSTDGGLTWSYLSNWGSGTGTNRVFYLFVDPGSATNLIVTTKTGIYFSNDGGTTFTLKYTDGTNNGLTIGGVFWDGQNIYVGTNAGLLASNNSGGSFILSTVGGIPGSEAIFSMSGAKTGSAVRLFAVTVSTTAEVVGTHTDPLYSNDVYGHFVGVYKLDIGSPNWTPAVSGIAAGDQPVLVTMALNDINTAYLGGRIANNSARVVYKTTNAGATWTSVFLTNNNQNIYNGWGGQGGDLGGTWWVGPILHDIAAAPNNANKVITTDQDGLTYLTTDGGATWHQVYTDPTAQYPPGLPTTHQHKYYSGNGHEPTVAWWIMWLDFNNMFAAFADITAIRSKDGGSSWSFDWNGLNFGSNYMADTYHFVKHPSSGTLYAAQSNGHGMIYQAVCLTDACIDTTAGGLRFSTDNGQNWTGMTNLTNPVLWLAIDPNTTTRIYAAVANSTSGGIYMSNNFQVGASATWTKLTGPTRTEGHPQNIFVLNDGTLLATFSARINEYNLFTQSSGVFISSNGGTTWTDRSDPKMTYYTRHLIIDPTDSTQNTWYVGTYGDWGMGSNNISGGLFKTTDRGQHWSQIYSGDGVESVTVNPTNADELYVATSRSGLLYSSNATSATPSFTQLSSYPFLRPARIFFNPYDNDEIWIASAGNGLRVGRIGYALTVNNGGTGSGTVTSSPAGISCGSGCSSTFTSGTSVTLTATADSSSTFTSWAGCDSTIGKTCTVSMSAAKSVTVTFDLSSYTLTISKSGSGSGIVTSSPGGINCGSTCSANYTAGRIVTLLATPSSDSIFAGWSGGGCTDTGMCSITMNAAATVTATFNTSSPTCTYTPSSTSQTFTASAGSGTVAVTASSSSCTNTWIAISNVSWITISSGSSGTGSGTVNYTVTANATGATRTGNMTIAGQTFTITQSDTAFADVASTNVFYSYINAIYNAAITRGCNQNPLMYCPDADVTRGQMAAFIIRAKYGENFTYTSTPYFSDVPATNVFFKYVQKMKDDAITTVTGTYGVNDVVTRGQMAAFIIRAKYGENFTYTSTPYFSDVPATNAFFKYVQKLKDDNITALTGTYYVDAVVTRGQMAAFIARAFLNIP